jgi:hypothetical protein
MPPFYEGGRFGATKYAAISEQARWHPHSKPALVSFTQIPSLSAKGAIFMISLGQRPRIHATTKRQR